MRNTAPEALERPGQIATESAPGARRVPLDDLLVSAVFQVLLWGYALFAVASSFGEKLNKFDDVIPLVGGMLVHEGRIPNLDFYSFYPPLGLYVNAAVFHLLGKSVIAVRLIAAVFYVLVLLLTMRCFRLRFPHSSPLVPAAVLVVAQSIGVALILPPWPGFAVALLALLIYLYSFDGAKNRLEVVALSGVLTGLALLYRVNFGGYVAIVVACDLLLGWWMSGKEPYRHARLASNLRTAAVFALPPAIVCLVFCFSVYGRNLGSAVFQFVVTAQRLMTLRGFIDLLDFSAVPYAVILPPAWFIFRILKGREVLPAKALVPTALAMVPLALVRFGHAWVPVAPIIAGFELAAVIFLHLFIRRLERSELCTLLFFCGLVHYFVSRADWYHFRILPIGMALLLPYLVLSGSGSREAEGESWVSKGTALAVLLAALVVCLLDRDLRPVAGRVPPGLRLVASLVRHPHMTDTSSVLGTHLPTAAWSSGYGDADELRALRYLRARTTSSDAIFVGGPDHSRIFWNNLRLYWLADRPVGVRTFQLETRMATETNVQEQIVSDLRRNHVQWIMIDYAPFPGDETFKARNYVGSKLLDDYIGSHFRQEARFGSYAVLSRVIASAE